MSNQVKYKPSPTKGFTCVDLDKTPEHLIMVVSYEALTDGWNYIQYTGGDNRPAFIRKDNKWYWLHCNEMGGYHLGDVYTGELYEQAEKSRSETFKNLQQIFGTGGQEEG